MVNIRISGFTDTVSDGVGMGLAIFFSGCNRGCKGCQNPKLQSFGAGYDCYTHGVISYLKLHGAFYDSVVFTGGDPYYQMDALIDLAENIDITKVLYTGALIEELPSSLVANIDVIVDGPYIEELATGKFPASSNQRILCGMDMYKEFMRNKNLRHPDLEKLAIGVETND
jgi:anaerobic ribonucleoside-triphosphate reductase activating protein